MTDATRERPILFSAPMIQALLAGRKTMTRRIVKPQPRYESSDLWCGDGVWHFTKPSGEKTVSISVDSMRETGGAHDLAYRCPYGAPGDRLWVRETFAAWRDATTGRQCVEYRADGHYSRSNDGEPRWRPSIFMPRALSRITLEVTSVRVERVQEISEDDSKAEGATPMFVMDPASFVRGGAIPPSTHRNGFESLWREINGGKSWDGNPWVWVVELRRVA